MEEYDIWNKTTDQFKSDYMTFINEWKYHYAGLYAVTDVESLFCCCEEIMPLLKEFIPIFGAYQKELFSGDEKDEALKKMSEAHKFLYDSVKQEMEKINAFLERDRELKGMGYSIFKCVYENGIFYITRYPIGTLYYIWNNV